MTWALIPLMALLNRFRGGGYGAEILPGHPRFYVAPLVALLVGLLFDSWHAGVLVGVSYLAWSFMPWGHLIGLGRWSPERPIAWTEGVSLIVGRNPWMALFLTELVGMSVAIVLVSPWAAVAALAFVGCYELGWRLRPKAPIELAELLVGAVWAALILVALSGCAPPKSDYWGSLASGVGQVQRNAR